jgi:hypothetical protein
MFAFENKLGAEIFRARFHLFKHKGKRYIRDLGIVVTPIVI